MVKNVSGEPITPIVDIEDISRSYQTGSTKVKALKNINLEIDRGIYGYSAKVQNG